MKILIEKEEWQLLGQLAIEVSEGKFGKGLSLHSTILWEFYRDNSEAFMWPQRRRRKMRFSTVLALQKCLLAQSQRGDALWDTTLLNLTDKVTTAILEFIKS